LQNIDINNLKDFKNFLDETIQMKLRENIVRKSGNFSVDFSEIRKEIDFIYDLKNKFENIEDFLLPDSFFERLKSDTNQLINAINQISSFNFASSNPAAERDGIINNFKNCFYNFFYKISPLLPYIELLNIENRINSLDISKIEEAKADFENIAKNLNQGLNHVMDLMKEAGVAKHSKNFDREANDRRDDAKLWLKTTIFFALASLTSPFYLPSILHWAIGNNDLQLLSSKIVIIAMLISAALWCGRVYKANKHQETLSRHKEIALSTFKTFVDGTEDPAIRNAVLMEASRAIFATPTSGYVATADQASNEMTILEMVKNIPKS
jgi:hypothetical protein